jgi:hypothetical protein
MINFLEVERSVQALKAQIAAGQIDQATFEACLLKLIDIAPDGYYWMFGHETETWYRHDGQQWLAADPGELVTIIPQYKPPARNSRTPAEVGRNPGPGLETLNWGWFVVSLIWLGLIAWIVYSSVA